MKAKQNETQPDEKEDFNGDYDMERIAFLVNAAYSNDDGTGKSFAIAIGLIQGIVDAYRRE